MLANFCCFSSLYCVIESYSMETDRSAQLVHGIHIPIILQTASFPALILVGHHYSQASNHDIYSLPPSPSAKPRLASCPSYYGPRTFEPVSHGDLIKDLMKICVNHIYCPTLINTFYYFFKELIHIMQLHANLILHLNNSST